MCLQSIGHATCRYLLIYKRQRLLISQSENLTMVSVVPYSHCEIQVPLKIHNRANVKVFWNQYCVILLIFQRACFPPPPPPPHPPSPPPPTGFKYKSTLCLRQQFETVWTVRKRFQDFTNLNLPLDHQNDIKAINKPYPDAKWILKGDPFRQKFYMTNTGIISPSYRI